MIAPPKKPQATISPAAAPVEATGRLELIRPWPSTGVRGTAEGSRAGRQRAWGRALIALAIGLRLCTQRRIKGEMGRPLYLTALASNVVVPGVEKSAEGPIALGDPAAFESLRDWHKQWFRQAAVGPA